MPDLLPVFLNVARRRVVLVGGGRVAAAKLPSLVATGARVTIVAPDVREEIARSPVDVVLRAFEPSDLDGAWLVVAAATPNVNADDDPANASAFLGGVVRREGVTIAISTSGDAPALSGLLREALDAVLPGELGAWMNEARRQRVLWRRSRVLMENRRPLLLRALNRLYRSEESRP